ncbi:hypothetical protein LCGC14_2799070, partial [marine sediment metagenome]
YWDEDRNQFVVVPWTYATLMSSTWASNGSSYITAIGEHADDIPKLGPLVDTTWPDETVDKHTIYGFEDLVEFCLNSEDALGIVPLNFYQDPSLGWYGDPTLMWYNPRGSSAQFRPMLTLTYDDTQLEGGPGSSRGTESFAKVNWRRLTTCWKIERADGQILRFTDHDVHLMLPDAYFYSPVAGMKASARQRAVGLRSLNLNIMGVITSTDIAHEDLYKGFYRGAKITEYLVDWRYPWAATIKTAQYWIESTTFNGETWEAEVVGVANKLRRPIGTVCSRNCRHILGDSICRVDMDELKASPVPVTAVVQNQMIFDCSNLSVVTPDIFSHGKIEWLTGDNTGVISEISEFYLSDTRLVLVNPTPFPIQVADQFSIWVGCDKRLTTCYSKFLNVDNFGGFPTIPGPDKTMM